jgi:hypothetical protein
MCLGTFSDFLTLGMFLSYSAASLFCRFAILPLRYSAASLFRRFAISPLPYFAARIVLED